MQNNEPGSVNLNRHLRLFVDSVTDYALYLLSPDGTIRSWNTGARRIKGFDREEVVGTNFRRFFTARDQARQRPEHALATARLEGRFADEGWRVRKDGSEFWASVVIDPIWNGRHELIGFIKITRDVTDKYLAVEALRQSEERYRLLLNNVTQYAIFTLDPAGHVTSWSPGAEQITRYSQDEAPRLHVSILYPAQDIRAGRPDKALQAAREAGRHEEEGLCVRKDGGQFWASIVIERVIDQHGAFAGFTTVMRDITERHRMDIARGKLLEAQRLETVGRLTGGIAHEFNNVLTAVIGSVDLIAQTSTDPATTRRATIAYRAAERGSALVSQLLAFSQQQVLRPKLANLNAILRQFERLFANSVGAGVGLSYDLVEGLGFTFIDPVEFASAMMNIVINAGEAIAARKHPDKVKPEIAIVTRNVTLDPADIGDDETLEPGRYVEISVQDSGCGMEPHIRDQAIEPFFTTKTFGQGSGLGLSQAYGFARQSKGRLTIQSSPGGGTIVRMSIPHARATAERGTVAAPVFGPGPVETILVVDDDAEVLEAASATIRSFGYRVVEASEGAQALRHLAHDPTIVLLFADIVMPNGMTGVELAQEAGRRYPHLKVLLTSGYSQEILEANESIYDGIPFIGKPYTRSALSAMLRALSMQDYPC